MGRMGIHNPTAYCTQSPRTERGHTVIQHTRFIHGCFSVQGAYKRKQIMGSYGHTSHTYTILLHPTPSNLDPTAYSLHLKTVQKENEGSCTYTVHVHGCFRLQGAHRHTIQKKTNEWGHTPPFCTQSPSLDPTYTTTLHYTLKPLKKKTNGVIHTIHGSYTVVSVSMEHTKENEWAEWGHTQPFCTQSPSLDPTANFAARFSEFLGSQDPLLLRSRKDNS